MKTILLNKVPTDENGWSKFPTMIVGNIHNRIQQIITENDMDCVLITSPLELTAVTGNQKIITIDCKEYSYNELQEIIEKAYMYDDLCK
jgi:hypothetical protein